MSERILIRGVNWVGDAVMTIPAIHALRHAHPEAHIALLVKPLIAELFTEDPNVDEIIVYEDAHRSIKGRFALAGKLRAMKFDRAVLLQNAFDAALITALARIPVRIGFARDARGPLLTNPVPYDNYDRTMHHIDYYMKLLKDAGLIPADAPTPEPWLYLSTEERQSALKTLSTLRPPVIGINPGAAFGSAKQWMAQSFAEVARRVIEELGGSAVIFGGPNEREIAGVIADSLKDLPEGRLMNLAGKTSIRELAADLAACDVMLSNDSGPMHIGYALQIPLVSIFGSTSSALTGPPASAISSVFQSQLPCSPCFERTCPRQKQTEGKPLCMSEISATDVFERIRALIPTRRAVFFDRDGTLCEDAHFLNNWADLRMFPDIGALNELKNKGFLLIGISNQSGIGRGIVDEPLVLEMNEHFKDNFGLDAFYYCPHHPDHGCSCRKPEPDMMLRARREFAIDFRRSFVVGDRDADMLIARATGATPVLVQTGKQQDSPHAAHTASTLSAAVKYILSESD